VLRRAAIGPAGLLLTGPAGIGKSTLWRAAVAEARERGINVLETRAVEAEVQLAFGGLADLLGEVVDGAADALPVAQREAIDLALQRIAAEGREPAPLAVSLGVLGILRAVAGRGPLLLAVDDLPWLDPSSSRVLEFALRRLVDEPIGLLASMRTHLADSPLPSVVVSFPRPVERMHVGPVGPDALGPLLDRALSTSFRRPALARIHAESGGNPFFAIEIARAVQRAGGDIGLGVLELPTETGRLVGGRLDELPTHTREPLAAVAALAQPTGTLLEAAFPGAADAIDAAVAAGVIEEGAGRLRFTHPLLAAAAYGRLDPEERRRLHRRLSEVAPDPEQCARHLALASEGPDEAVAARLEAAAFHARARAATEAGAELAREAASRTPAADVTARRRRAVAAAGLLVQAGDPAAARRLLEDLVDTLPPGADRAEALLALADTRSADDWRAKMRLLGEALVEAGDDHRLRSAILEQRSQAKYHLLVDAAGSLADARDAVDAARHQDDPAVLSSALQAGAFAEANLGAVYDPALIDEALALEPQVQHLRVFLWPSFAAALIDLDRDRIGVALERLMTLRERATALGDWDSLPLIALNLAWANWRGGDWTDALAHAVEAERGERQNGQATGLCFALAVRAMIEGSLGREREALAAAAEGLAVADRIGVRGVAGELRAVVGLIALAKGDYPRAESELRAAVEPTEMAGYRWAFTTYHTTDWAEALVYLGRTEEALGLVDRFEARVRQRGAPSALATCLRVRGLAAAATGDEGSAIARFADAAAQHDLVEEPFERARTLLAHGESLRRFRQRGLARSVLASALDQFERLGAPRWRDRAAAELARTGHRSAGAELSGTERQVAELVAAGRTNREVAEALFMSPHTVEAHLTRIYRSLGVRGRTEMARALATRDDQPASADE
jgi:DNA-binding CsgD family transcriptional regulator